MLLEHYGIMVLEYNGPGAYGPGPYAPGPYSPIYAPGPFSPIYPPLPTPFPHCLYMLVGWTYFV